MHAQHWLEDDDLDRILKNYDDNEDGGSMIHQFIWLLSVAYRRAWPQSLISMMAYALIPICAFAGVIQFEEFCKLVRVRHWCALPYLPLVTEASWQCSLESGQVVLLICPHPRDGIPC